MANFGKGLADFGMLALDTTGAGIASKMLTGKGIADHVGYQYQTGFGQMGDQVVDAATGLQRKAGSMVIPGGQMINQIGGQAIMKRGGIVSSKNVNIEKGELEVDPNTGEIVRDFSDAPEHPDNKNLIDVRGDRMVKVGNAIIPADKREAYIKGDVKERKIIISSLPSTLENGKAAGGLYDVPTESSLPQSNANYSVNGIYNVPTQDQFFNQQNTATQYGYVPAPVTNAPINNVINNNNDTGDRRGLNMTNTGGILGSIPQAILGYQQYKAGKRGLEELNKTPRAQYSIAPEMNVMRDSYNAALGRANTGFTGAQNAAFNQGISRANNTAFQNAVNMSGGGMANVMRGALNAQNLNAYNTHAAQDADLQLRKQQYADALGSQYARAYQNQRNLMTQDQITDRLRKEQALGKAAQDGRLNMTNAGSQFGTAVGNALERRKNPNDSVSPEEMNQFYTYAKSMGII